MAAHYSTVIQISGKPLGACAAVSDKIIECELILQDTNVTIFATFFTSIKRREAIERVELITLMQGKN